MTNDEIIKELEYIKTSVPMDGYANEVLDCVIEKLAIKNRHIKRGKNKMEETLKMIITAYRNCDRGEGIRLCTECMANARIGFTKTTYCEFLREHGKQAIDDINTVMENVL